jgi:hypothetical protein
VKREREREIEMERVRSGQDDENGETIGRSRNEPEKLALVFQFIFKINKKNVAFRQRK